MTHEFTIEGKFTKRITVNGNKCDAEEMLNEKFQHEFDEFEITNIEEVEPAE